MVKCGACGRYLKPVDGVRCSGSKCGEAQYHRACVGFSTKANVSPDWRCPECKKNIARDNKAETPVRAVYSLCNLECSPNDGSSPGSSTSTHTACAEVLRTGSMTAGSSQQMSPTMRSEYLAILDELRAVREELTRFRRHMEDELVTLRGTVTKYSEQVEAFESRLKTVERHTLNHAKVDSVIDELRQQLNDRDQELLVNDIDVNNIPEANSENLMHVVMAIGQKLGVKVDERDIVSAERIGKRHLNAGSSQGPTEPRPPRQA